ncbi:DUF5779 family protein [Salarchaeum japonicum]|uniref:DUF5779 family protein n=1 Tax=Salarchaeum japonicum TaxID=555573 RepID=UPI003C767854
MSDFELDLRSAEEHLSPELESDFEGRVVLGVLDGDTGDEEWLGELEAGNVLVLAVDGDLDDLAGGFAGPVKDAGGTLMHFRSFLVVTPPGVDVDTDRLE